VKPSVPMKALFWDRLVLGPKESRATGVPIIWDGIQEGNLVTSEFEKHFAAAQKKEKEKVEEATPNKKSISVLDGKRSNAIAIMMSKLPELDSLVSAIERLDDNKLSQENIEALIEQLPTKEEIEAIQAAKNPDVPFDKPERFAMTIASVPKVAERLKCWNFMKLFEEKKKDVFVPLCRIKSACYQLKAYEPLKAILGMILACGNYLNGGTARGQADGFVVSMLPKLADTKSAFDKNTNLLSFIVKHLYANRPTLLAMGALPELQEAGKVPLSEVEAGLNALTTETKATKAMCLVVQSELQGKDPKFESVIVPFLDEAERTLKHLDVLFKETCGLFMDILLYFGWSQEKAKSITNDKFFGDMHMFMESFINLWKVEEAVEERKSFEKMMEKKARLEALSGGKRPEKGAPGDRTSTSALDSVPNNSKATLRKKFRNSAQHTPLPITETSLLANGHGDGVGAKEALRDSVASPPPQNATPSPAANLKNKFRR